MATIIMAVHDTDDNGRTAFTKETLHSLSVTVDLTTHTLLVIDNGSCAATKELLAQQVKNRIIYQVLTLEENIGTAAAINLGIRARSMGEPCIKLDNDVTFQYTGWVDEMEVVMAKEPAIGILGLKRRDLEERPDHESPLFRSELIMLPHEPGDRWTVVERVQNMMGTCTMFSPDLLDAIGYMRQATEYGLDDYDFSVRSRQAGFINCFLPHIPITHIDTGANEQYAEWKKARAAEAWPKMVELARGYMDGTVPLYYDGSEDRKSNIIPERSSGG